MPSATKSVLIVAQVAMQNRQAALDASVTVNNVEDLASNMKLQQLVT